MQAFLLHLNNTEVRIPGNCSKMQFLIEVGCSNLSSGKGLKLYEHGLLSTVMHFAMLQALFTQAKCTSRCGDVPSDIRASLPLTTEIYVWDPIFCCVYLSLGNKHLAASVSAT